MRHDVESDILCRNALLKLAFYVDAHRLWLRLKDTLRSKDLCHFARTDTHRNGSNGSVGAGVRVAADNRHTRQGKPLLGTNNMDDAVVLRSHCKVADAELLAIGSERLHLLATYRVIDAFLLVAGGVMVWHRKDLFRSESLDALVAKRVESLRACHLMGIKPVDIKLCWAIFNVLHNMSVPNLIKERDPL